MAKRTVASRGDELKIIELLRQHCRIDSVSVTYSGE